MRINEVMKETGLTKKAIYYYENEGLISPTKEPGNNYRVYTDEDVRKLIKINILRRLDVPIKAIGGIIFNAVSIKDILKEQLILTNQKMNIMFHNKMIINELITKDIEEADFSFDTLKDFDLRLDNMMAGPGHLGKELERIFPGTLGRLFAVFYNNFFNIPLDTEEKASAWNELVRKLDGMQEIDCPEEIKKIVDDMYEEVVRDRLSHLGIISNCAVTAQVEKSSPHKQESVMMTKEAIEEYYANPNRKDVEGYYKLQNFISANPEVFKEVDRYIGQVNECLKKNP